MGLIRVPASICHLAKLAAEENPRYVITGVKVTVAGERATVIGTNGMTAGILTFPAKAAGETELLQGAECDQATAIIPAWVLEDIQKQYRRRRLETLTLGLGDKVSSLMADPGAWGQVWRVRNEEGKFPDAESIIPRDEPAITLKIDPQQLARLLTVAGQFGYERGEVTIEIRKPESVVVVRSKDAETGAEFTGLIMPRT